MSKPEDHQFTGPELCKLEAHQAVDLLAKREISPNDLLEASSRRVAAIEPAVNAMPTLCFERAQDALKRLAKGDSDSPGWLGGLPTGIKDLAPVKGVRTTFGTKALAENVPEVSDPLVERLEQRGALVVGKTNTPEFGAGGNTFNDVLGKTRNPWNTSLNAGGSSGGAAVSLATGEVWLSHGSDHGGSLRTPAAYNGIVGLRPSPGVCASDSQAGFLIEGQQGPMARSVRDCALFLDAMAGFQPNLPTSWPAPHAPYQQAVIRADTKVRIAFSPDLNGLSPVEPEIDLHLRAALRHVENNGGVVEEVQPTLPNLETTYHTLRGMLWATSFERTPKRITRHFKDTLTENIAFGRALTMKDVAEANLNRTILFKTMTAFLQDFDVLACPVVGNMQRPIEEEWAKEINGQALGGYMDWLRFAFLATVTGLPAISVPVGLSKRGLPVGIQLIGKHREDAKLLAVARAIELAVGGPWGPIDPVTTSSPTTVSA